MKQDPKIQQRLAIDKTISMSAAKGNPIAGMTESLLHIASQHAATQFVAETGMIAREEELDSDEDFPIF